MKYIVCFVILFCTYPLLGQDSNDLIYLGNVISDTSTFKKSYRKPALPSILESKNKIEIRMVTKPYFNYESFTVLIFNKKWEAYQYYFHRDSSRFLAREITISNPDSIFSLLVQENIFALPSHENLQLGKCELNTISNEIICSGMGVGDGVYYDIQFKVGDQFRSYTYSNPIDYAEFYPENWELQSITKIIGIFDQLANIHDSNNLSFEVELDKPFTTIKKKDSVIYLGNIVADSSTLIKAVNLFEPRSILESKNQIEIRLINCTDPYVKEYFILSCLNGWKTSCNMGSYYENRKPKLKELNPSFLDSLFAQLVSENIFSLLDDSEIQVGKCTLEKGKKDVLCWGKSISHGTNYAIEFKVGKQFRRYTYSNHAELLDFYPESKELQSFTKIVTLMEELVEY